MTAEREIIKRLLAGWTVLAGDDRRPAHWYRVGETITDIPADQLAIVVEVLEDQGVIVPEACPECGRGPAHHLPDWQGNRMCLKEREAPVTGGLGRMMARPDTRYRSDPQG